MLGAIRSMRKFEKVLKVVFFAPAQKLQPGDRQVRDSVGDTGGTRVPLQPEPIALRCERDSFPPPPKRSQYLQAGLPNPRIR